MCISQTRRGNGLRKYKLNGRFLRRTFQVNLTITCFKRSIKFSYLVRMSIASLVLKSYVQIFALKSPTHVSSKKHEYEIRNKKHEYE